jgi:molybdopterin converting factor subunit 1
MNNVKVLFFATLKEKAGMNSVDLQIPNGMVVSELKDYLFQNFPGLPKSRANLIVAVNKEFAFDQEAIPDNAEIAVFPPVSGG